MRLTSIPVLAALALASAPAAAQADATWTCAASAGWLAGAGQRSDAPSVGGSPCPSARTDAGSARNVQGSLAATGTVSVDGGTPEQTTDTRSPQASVSAGSVSIRDADGLMLDASKLSAQAGGSCDPARRPMFASSGSPGTVMLNGRPIDTTREYSEPGVGVNGAPLFGKLTVRFNEVAKSDAGISRRALHVIVTDRDGAVVFEAVAGEVATGRDGPVCDPPPVCPAGQEPQAGRCVEVTVAPLPPPPVPVAPPPAGVQPRPKRRPHGCRDADAKARKVSVTRLAKATLCLMNAARKRRHLGVLRPNAALAGAARRHARDMVARRYFSHDEPGGAGIVERVLQTGYLGRFGHWQLGENLGWGWGSGATPRLIMRAWMRSNSHRSNILGKRFHDAGVAILVGSPGRSRAGSLTYVVDFGGFARRTRNST